MPHEDFFEKILIEFVELKEGHEIAVAKFKSFSELPVNLQFNSEDLNSVITLEGKKWKIIGINTDLRAHGKGIHMKVKLEKNQA
jgi:predicted RNA-binding protein YlqC (UPF0109 family)